MSQPSMGRGSRFGRVASVQICMMCTNNAKNRYWGVSAVTVHERRFDLVYSGGQCLSVR
eukprot:SAG22_NODE_19664_length_272_cov_1.780347_1_plen_58_part_10